MHVSDGNIYKTFPRYSVEVLYKELSFREYRTIC